MGLFSSLFKSYSEKQIKRIIPTVDKIEALADKYAAMSDEELKAMTETLKGRLAAGETLDDILPDAYALVREADERVLGKRPFRVQLIGAILLHQGRIAEMKTGEGKTLVATMPAYLNALAGKGVHIVTVNEYLARRDKEEMGKVYTFLGLTVGLLERTYDLAAKKAAYAADITYGMNSEFGFDYLRDNLAKDREDTVARGYDFAIVDEVDSILIDEAKTPLIISSASGKSTALYAKTDKLVKGMRAKVMTEADSKEDYSSFEEHFIIDETSGSYAIIPSSLQRFARVFSLDAKTDLVSTVDYGIALTASGKEKLIASHSFTDEELVSFADGEEYFFTDEGKRKAEPYLNEVITGSSRGDTQSLTEHGRDKLIKFFDFTEDMFTDDGESYSIIAKAKSHAMKELSLTESDFATFERNFVVNDKAKVASFLELGVRNAVMYFGFNEDDFVLSPISASYTLTEKGAKHLSAIFKLNQNDVTPAKDGSFYINRQAILKIKELFSRNFIIDERQGTLTPTLLGMSKIAAVFSLEKDTHYKVDDTSYTAVLTKSGIKQIIDSYSLSDGMFDKQSDGVWCLSERGKRHFSRYSELSDSSFSLIRSSCFGFTDAGIKDMKRQFSLSDSEIIYDPHAAYLTSHGIMKLVESFDLGSKAAVTVSRKNDSYALSRGARDDLCERLGIDKKHFTEPDGVNGCYLLEGALEEIKRHLTLVEIADFVFVPRIGFLTDKGKARLFSTFNIEKENISEKDGLCTLSKDTLGIFKRIASLNELYSPLTLTKGGIDRLRAAINFDYIVSEKNRTATLTKIGIGKAEKYFGIDNIADDDNQELLHHVNIALQAYGTMKKDVHYIVVNRRVLIVDQSTGRVLEGRRFNDGLHQAIEAKEGVEIQAENKTTATISYQNFFRMYRKLSGMTGTAITEQDEFREIYTLDVVEVPTNKPVIRKDHKDTVFTTHRGKLNAILTQIITCYKKGQPVLVGTTSVEKSEEISALLRREKIPHSVLNAKEHGNEANLIASAGMPGAVTISTNMAGRGTDIMLGGNPAIQALNKLRNWIEAQNKFRAKGRSYTDYLVSLADSTTECDEPDVTEVREKYKELLLACKKEREPLEEKVKEAGGLFVIGAERHDSRRIDNQLRGRSGRQGDVGESRFYVSLEDDLMRFFGEKVTGMLSAVGIDENTPIQLSIMSSRIEDAQKRVEARHFQNRKHLLSYDDVMNEQRKVIYAMRNEILDCEDIRPKIEELIAKCVGEVFDDCYLTNEESEKTPMDFASTFKGALTLPDEQTDEDSGSADLDALRQKYIDRALELYSKRIEAAGKASARMISGATSSPEIIETLSTIPTLAYFDFQRSVLLSSTDKCWINHLDRMDDLKSYVGLNSYAQRNPLTVYQLEGAQMFSDMMKEIRLKTTLQVLLKPIDERMISHSRSAGRAMAKFAPEELRAKPTNQEISLNAPCPCGSGKKYKRCCYLKNQSGGNA